MKNFILTLFISISLFSANSQIQKFDSTALILIDIQDFYFPGGKAELVESEKAGEQAKLLLNYFRENNGLIIYVRHNFEPGGNIHKLVEPIEEEKIISKDEVNAFLNTDLNEYLRKNNVRKVILCGMQTQMCLEAATRAAHDLGYNCTVIEDACTTRDIKYNDVVIPAKEVHYSTLATLKNYAEVVTLNEFLKN